MLTRVDRLLVATTEAEPAAERWCELFDAQRLSRGRAPRLSATSIVLRCGTTDVELLEPDGAGLVADHIKRAGAGIFGAGVATDDLGRVERRLAERKIRVQREGDRIQLEPEEMAGLPLIISRDEPRKPSGLLDHVFEVTHLVTNGEAVCRRFMDLFGLPEENRCHFSGEAFGYRTHLPTFDPARRLDRIEFGEPVSGSAMDRFLARRGPSPYMCHVEAVQVGPIRERLMDRGLRFTESPPASVEDLLYVHPSSLGGVLMGVCRRGHFSISRRDGHWYWSVRDGMANADEG